MRWAWLWVVCVGCSGSGPPSPWGGHLEALELGNQPSRVAVADNGYFYAESKSASRDSIAVALGAATVGVWIASSGGDWRFQGWLPGGVHEIAVPFAQPLFVALRAQKDPATVGIGWSSALFDGERATSDEYAWGFGGDLDANGRVDELDLQLIDDALGGFGPLHSEYDFDGNGVVDAADRQQIEDVAAGKRAALLSADAIESDSADGTSALLEVHGMGLTAGSQVQIGTEITVGFDQVGDDGNGALVGTLAITDEQLGMLRALDGSRVRLVGDDAPGVPLNAALGWSELEDDLLADNAPSVPSPTPRASPPAMCCYVTLVTFTAAAKGLKLRAYALDDHGVEATHKINEDSDDREIGIDIRDPGAKQGPNTLKGPFREAHFRVLDAKGATLAELVINCDTPKTLTLTEQQPDALPGMTVPRPQALVQILDIQTKTQPCTETVMPSVATGEKVVPWDNMIWPGHSPSPTPHPGSGAIALFAADSSTFADVGCNKACWAQVVETRIDIQPNGGMWTNLVDDKPHNDNLDSKNKPLFPGTTLAGSYPWFCYAFQAYSVEDGMPRITLRDGPHIDHNFSYKDASGKLVTVGNGDLVRRRSSFYTKLLCVDPMLPTPLEAYSWTMTTLYNPVAGAKTKVDGPNRETPSADNPRAQICRTKRILDDFLKKKKARESK